MVWLKYITVYYKLHFCILFWVCFCCMPHHFQKFFRRFREDLIIFPDHMHFHFPFRCQRAEAESAVTGGIDNFVKGNGITQPFFHEKGGIEEQVVGGDNIQFGNAAFHPLYKLAAARLLLGDNERLIPQIFRGNGRFFWQGRVFSHHYAPNILWGELQSFIFF